MISVADLFIYFADKDKFHIFCFCMSTPTIWNSTATLRSITGDPLHSRARAHSRASLFTQPCPIVHTAVPRENNEHGCVYLRCRAVCKLPGCVEGHPWVCGFWLNDHCILKASSSILVIYGCNLQIKKIRTWTYPYGLPCKCMMTSSNENNFRVIGPLCGEFTGHRWIPRTKASDAKLWCFLWFAPEPTVEQKMETPVIWDAIVLIRASV